jgi:hypothetical protein
MQKASAAAKPTGAAGNEEGRKRGRTDGEGACKALKIEGSLGFVRLCWTLRFKKYLSTEWYLHTATAALANTDSNQFRRFPEISNQFQSIPIKKVRAGRAIMGKASAFAKATAGQGEGGS